MLSEVVQHNPRLRRLIVPRFMYRAYKNYVTLLSLFTAILAGYALYMQQFIVGSLLVLLSGWLDAVDGEIARSRGATKFGDLLDHTVDRIADFVFLLGITFSGVIPVWLGVVAIVTVSLVSYIGTQSQALTAKREYSGILGRSDRIVLITVIGLLQTVYANSILYGMYAIVILSSITFIQRFVSIAKAINSG